MVEKKGIRAIKSLFDEIRILSWNVRGANDIDKRRMIKDVIKSLKADLVCL